MKRKFSRFLAAVSAMGLSHVALASMETMSSRAEVYLPGYSPEKAVSTVHDGFSWLLNPARKNIRFLPSPMPSRPESAGLTQVYLGGVGVPDLECPTAYAEFTFMPRAKGNSLGGSGEIYRGCLYAFEKGFKLDVLVTTYRAADTGLGSAIFGGIGKMVQGSDEENLAKWTNRLMGKLKENAPDMLVALIEMPGSPKQQPDIEAVKALLPLQGKESELSSQSNPAPAEQPNVDQALDPRIERKLLSLPPEQRELARQQVLLLQKQMRMQGLPVQ